MSSSKVQKWRNLSLLPPPSCPLSVLWSSFRVRSTVKGSMQGLTGSHTCYACWIKVFSVVLLALHRIRVGATRDPGALEPDPPQQRANLREKSGRLGPLIRIPLLWVGGHVLFWQERGQGDVLQSRHCDRAALPTSPLPHTDRSRRSDRHAPRHHLSATLRLRLHRHPT